MKSPQFNSLQALRIQATITNIFINMAAFTGGLKIQAINLNSEKHLNGHKQLE